MMGEKMQPYSLTVFLMGSTIQSVNPSKQWLYSCRPRHRRLHQKISKPLTGISGYWWLVIHCNLLWCWYCHRWCVSTLLPYCVATWRSSVRADHLHWNSTPVLLKHWNCHCAWQVPRCICPWETLSIWWHCRWQWSVNHKPTAKKKCSIEKHKDQTKASKSSMLIHCKGGQENGLSCRQRIWSQWSW